MHRTTTAATLLVTVAVSALSGCVTVQRAPAPGSSPVPALPSVPRPDGSGEPRIVQAPARKALGFVGPPRAPAASRTPVPPAPAAAPAPSGASRQVPERPRTPQRPRAVPERRQQRHQHRGDQPVRVPDPTRSVTGNADVCALGKAYGGWPAGSPQAVICAETYGR
jgi:hypothetical protein